MTNSDKIILGSTTVIGISAITMLMLSKKYDNITNQVLSDLKNINYTLSKSREDIIIGNKEIAEGNRILRTLVKQYASENSEN